MNRNCPLNPPREHGRLVKPLIKENIDIEGKVGRKCPTGATDRLGTGEARGNAVAAPGKPSTGTSTAREENSRCWWGCVP